MKGMLWGALLASAMIAGAASASHFERVPAKDHTRTSPLAGNAEAVAGGARIYKEHCAQCHGADAQGDGRKKPSLRTDSVSAATDGDLEWFLRQGDIAHGMPSWAGLTQAQRWQLVAYLRTMRAAPAKP